MINDIKTINEMAELPRNVICQTRFLVVVVIDNELKKKKS